MNRIKKYVGLFHGREKAKKCGPNDGHKRGN